MHLMFSSCTTLHRLPWLELRVVEMMFIGCYALITVPLLNTVAVQTMTYPRSRAATV